MKNLQRKGFTIVELVIVIAVIAILAAVLIPTFSNVISNAKDSAALYEAKNAHTQYAVSHATEEMSDYFLYQKEENRIVAIHQGKAIGVYGTREEALNALLDDAKVSSLLDTGDGKLWEYRADSGAAPEIQWMIGAINEDNGEIYPEFTWHISTDFIAVTEGMNISVLGGDAEFLVFYYDEQKNYIHYTENWSSDPWAPNSQDYAYIRIMVRNHENQYASLTLDYAENIQISFS